MPSGAGGRLSSTFCLTPPSPGAPGPCSQGLGTCLSLVRRANKSSWPTSSSLTVSHFKIKIINTETYRGWKVNGEISGIRDEAQGLMQHQAAVTWQPAKGVSVSRTQTDKYQGWNSQGWTGGGHTGWSRSLCAEEGGESRRHAAGPHSS